MKNKQVRFIPYFIAEAVQKRQLPLATVFDVQKLMQFVSVNDLIAYCAMSDVSVQEILLGPHPTSLTYGNTENDCVQAGGVQWSDANFFTLVDTPINIELNPELGAAIEEFKLKVGRIFLDQSVVDDLKSRLFTEESGEERYKESFVIHDVTPQYYGVVIYPGFFVKEKPAQLHQQQFELIKAIQKQLYVYADFNEVCSTSLFRRYLHRLYHQVIVASW